MNCTLEKDHQLVVKLVGIYKFDYAATLCCGAL